MRYKWYGCNGVGKTLWEAILNEWSNSGEHSVIGRKWNEEYEANIKYYFGEDTDEQYAEYCGECGVVVPDDKDVSPTCPNCHHHLLSRCEWAEEKARHCMEFFMDDLPSRFNVDDDKEVAEYFGLDPKPVIFVDDFDNERPYEDFYDEIKEGEFWLLSAHVDDWSEVFDDELSQSDFVEFPVRVLKREGFDLLIKVLEPASGEAWVHGSMFVDGRRLTESEVFAYVL